MKIKDTAAVLVDGSNLYATCKALGFSVDFKKLIECFQGDILKAFYFTAMPPGEEQSTLRPMVDWLEFNGWTVFQKEYKEYRDRGTFHCTKCGTEQHTISTKIKGNMDIEIATVAHEIAPFVSDIFMFTGDGDFRFLIETLQRRHAVKVNIVSSIVTNPPMCADVLRRQADGFIELNQLREQIMRVDQPRFKTGSSR